MDHQTFAELLGNYGEFVGAIAVVVTLLYLSMQIRQNTRAMDENRKAVAAQSAREVDFYAGELHREVARDPELRKIVTQSLRTEPEEYSDDDWFAFRTYANALFFAFQAQYLNGAMRVGADEQVRLYLRVAKGMISRYPAWAQYWEREKAAKTWAQGFVDAVEATEEESAFERVFVAAS